MSGKKISHVSFELIYLFGSALLGGLIITTIEDLLKAAGVKLDSLSSGVQAGIGFLIWLFSIWVAIMAISWFINKNYELKNKKKALRSALTLFVVIGIVTIIALIAIGLSFSYVAETTIRILISGIVIYFLGNKYLKESRSPEKKD